MSKDLYTLEFHSKIEEEETPQAERLAGFIASNIRPSKYYDFGCSTGIYLRSVKRALPDISATGFEFSEAAIARAVCSNIYQADLTAPLACVKTPNTLGLCLEVLEHISDSKWHPVLENMTRLSDIIIFSAAVPGQGGTGHINCRPKIDWIRRFHSLGWVVDYDKTRAMQRHMQAGYHMGWFANNAIILVPAIMG
jgi:hypothetical protein